MNAFEEWLLHRPGVNEWFRETARVHGIDFTAADYEGLARLFASNYSRAFLDETTGKDVPTRAFAGHVVRVDGPGCLILMCAWILEEWPFRAVDLRARIVSLFEAASQPPPWALEVEKEVFQACDRVIARVGKPS